MIYYLVTRERHRLVERFLEVRGRALAGVLTAVPYDRILRARRIPSGHYIFADLERLAPREAERAAIVFTTLAASPTGGRVFNHPTLALRRYELLRRLHEGGINTSDVYRLTEAREPRRYPVFIRRENDHDGSRTPLLRDPDELRANIQAMDRDGASREDAIICEFCDTADEHGVYRKYSAFLVNGRVIPRHVFFSKSWIVKNADLVDAECVRFEQRYLDENPHEAKLDAIFALARVDYGRIDYGLRNGEIEVWEINTHPTLPTTSSHGGTARESLNAAFTARLVRALRELDQEPVMAGLLVPTGLPRPVWWRAPHKRLRRLLPRWGVTRSGPRGRAPRR